MKKPLLVLMYHRINTLRPDPWTTCVSPQHFEEQLEVIRSLPVGTVITFDDGYADNFENAKPLLEKHGQRAIIFVTSGMVGSAYEMWWDELDRRFLGQTPHKWDWDDADPDEGAKQYRAAFHKRRAQDFEIFETRPVARPERRMMTPDEVAEIAAGGLIEIGAHTVTHPVLSQLTLEQQRHEIFESKRALEEITGKPVSSFAYPNGGKGDYSEDSVRIVREAGYARAYAAWEAPLSEQYDLFQIPRMMVRDWNGDVFASVLSSKVST